MAEEYSYRVAGFYFTVAGQMPALDNLEPFRCSPRAGEEPVFRLQIVPDLAAPDAEFFFQTEDGPGFPEIRLDKLPGGGYLFYLRPLPGRPVAAEMLTDKDFSNARLRLCATDDCFALNNALMLMYAFSTANLGALQMHSSVILNDGRGYLFLGRSGTGKSTHSRLWLKHIPGSELLNDDNPILRLMPDGTARVSGSPWSGKTPCYKAMDAPVGAVVRLSQAPENRIARLSRLQAYASLMSSASAFRPFSNLADGWHRTLEGLAAVVDCYSLDCLPDEAAARLCYSTIHG
ncbi:MAG: hypothetical protein IJR25_04950 [Bacteroidales bacterium]|nr:hypothetical protein [Bacteroidales bacterium]